MTCRLRRRDRRAWSRARCWRGAGFACWCWATSRAGRLRRGRHDAVGGAGAAAAARRAARPRACSRSWTSPRTVKRKAAAPRTPAFRLVAARTAAGPQARSRGAGARARPGVRRRGRLGGRGHRAAARRRAAARTRSSPAPITLPPNGFWERREVGRLRVAAAASRTTDLFAPAAARASVPRHGRVAGGSRRGPGRARRRADREARAFDARAPGRGTRSRAAWPRCRRCCSAAWRRSAPTAASG